MRQVNSLNHTRWECKYPIVFIPKYRRKAIFGQIRKELADVFHSLATPTSDRSDLEFTKLFQRWRCFRFQHTGDRPIHRNNRTWAAEFVRWYNRDHRHSGIRYVSPAQRHAGEDHAILAARHALYLQARELTPARWSGKTHNWNPIGAVTLNPERDCVVKAHLEKVIRPLAA